MNDPSHLRSDALHEGDDAGVSVGGGGSASSNKIAPRCVPNHAAALDVTSPELPGRGRTLMGRHVAADGAGGTRRSAARMQMSREHRGRVGLAAAAVSSVGEGHTEFMPVARATCDWLLHGCL